MGLRSSFVTRRRASLSCERPLTRESRMSDPILLVTREAGIARVTLNRPEAMNALSRELRAALVEAFTSFALDPDGRGVILTRSGRAFCAGLDLKELGSGQGPIGGGRAGEPDIVSAMAAFGGPIIGGIKGVAGDGGFGLAL